MVFAIPSYRRPDKQETAVYLKFMGIPKEKIFIFVNSDECEAYKQNYTAICNVIDRGNIGSIPEARNFILDYFKDDEIVMMDDDISVISVGSKEKKFKEIPSGRLEEVFTKMFTVTGQLKGFMFGLYPVYNEYFMNNDISTKVTVNTILGFRKKFPLRFDNNYIAKEDIELCGRILNVGGNVIRFNNVAYKAKHRTNEGGVHEIWQSDANVKFSKDLALNYPRIFAVQKKKPSEVRIVIRDIKKKGISWTLQ